MNFDYIVGNPPYQDTSSGGSNKKLWKDITRRIQGRAKRQIIFVTPEAQVQYLLRKFTFYVDYQANDFFDVGTKIVAWGTASKPTNRKVFSSDGTIDSGWGDKPKRELQAEFEDLKSQPIRLFKRQSCEPGPLECVKNASKGTTDTCLEYVIPNGHRILAISTSKSLKRENIISGYQHYGSLYAQIDIDDWSDEKIEQFINDLLDPGFVLYCNAFREFYNTGFNNVLLYTDSLKRRLPKQ